MASSTVAMGDYNGKTIKLTVLRPDPYLVALEYVSAQQPSLSICYPLFGACLFEGVDHDYGHRLVPFLRM